MPNATLRANAQAMPSDRRAFLSAIAAASVALPAAAIAAMPSQSDAELIALGAEIVRRANEAEAFQESRVYIYEERFQALLRDESKPEKVRLDEAFAFSRESGRDAAVNALHRFDEATDHLFRRLMAIPATSQPGRAAKVRALLVHVMQTGWHGPAKELDWDREMARALLGEFAGISADELASI